MGDCFQKFQNSQDFDWFGDQVMTLYARLAQQPGGGRG